MFQIIILLLTSAKIIELADSSVIGYQEVDNLHDLPREEKSNYGGRSKRDASFALDKYHTLREINKWLESLEKSHRGVKQINIGQSIEYRSIVGIKIPSKTNAKETIVVEAGIHPREWISTAVALYLIDQLINGDDVRIQRLARYNWYIFPTINPDGYLYSWKEKHRFWRKNRDVIVPLLSRCVGVDLNRNWGYEWKPGTGKFPFCDETYPGPRPFSEPETQAMRDFLKKNRANLHGYISLHSFGQMIQFPYSYTETTTDNYSEDKFVAERAQLKIRHESRDHRQYRTGTLHELLKKTANGTSTDWVKHILKVPKVFTLELQPAGVLPDQTDRDGFLLAPTNIIPNGQDIIIGLEGIFTD